MNTLQTMFTAAILAAAGVILGFQTAAAQNAASTLPPALVSLAAKYQADLNALTEMRSKGSAPARQTYLTALTAAEHKATAERKPDELKVVSEEKDALTAGRAIAAVASPLLPRVLATPRASLLRETARAERDYEGHAQAAGAEYLRALGFYESKARAAGQADLLGLIEAEKLKLAGQAGPGARPGHAGARNLVINGDFAQRKEDGSPESWTPSDAHRGAVTAEQGTTFLRMVSGGTSVTYYLENAERPADALEMEVSLRARCRDMKGQGTYGIVIAQRDGNNAVLSRDTPCDLAAPSPVWKSLSGMVKLRPETRKLVIECRIINCLATVDFADVRVETR